MGYEMHLRRSDERGRRVEPISNDEWLALVAEDPTLNVQEQISAQNPRTGQAIALRTPGMVRHRDPRSGTECLFRLSHGEIHTRYAEGSLPKARELAGRLGATIWGDNGERI